MTLAKTSDAGPMTLATDTPENRPPVEALRDVDEGEGSVVPRRDGKRLEPGQTTAGSGAGATGMVAAPDRSGDRGPSGDGEQLPARGGGRGAIGGRQPASLAAKTGH